MGIKAQGKPCERKPDDKRRNVATIDMDTGEILQGTPVFFPKKERIGKDWAMIMLARLGEIAKDREMGTESWRVFALLLSRIDFENWIDISQAEMGRELGMAQQSVSRAMLNLERKGLVEKAKISIGKRNVYRLAPEVAWRGSTKNYKAMQDAKHAQTRQAVREIGDKRALRVIEGGAK